VTVQPPNSPLSPQSPEPTPPTSPPDWPGEPPLVTNAPPPADDAPPALNAPPTNDAPQAPNAPPTDDLGTAGAPPTDNVGAAPAAPYQGLGYPPPPPARGGTNGFAIASLIFGILGGVLFGIIFGIVALAQIRKRGQGGRGLAITGLVASGFWVLLLVVGITFAIVSGGDGGKDGSVAVTRLDPGDCVNGLEESESVQDFPVVPCSGPHEGEVFAVFDLANGPWPGDPEVQRQAQDRCQQELPKYAGTLAGDLDLYYLRPLERLWWIDRSVTCIATDMSGPRTGSIRQ
jgi:hypothetical protein